jgi:hypothetical protein
MIHISGQTSKRGEIRSLNSGIATFILIKYTGKKGAKHRLDEKSKDFNKLQRICFWNVSAGDIVMF